ncbi:hypothetical protein [Rhodococcoides kyotonense]|uniref:Secreted protein n=1 Tax=Rhodococcoides kyotonense TaxID=398843 RepID=A0A239JM76_9NOCA|nr:hypothetical protein [Rhodococcus kyotonensis]SNT05864.1 hypothetical protein SAMN05421642_108259 [Rhodococcus kyotonensis]
MSRTLFRTLATAAAIGVIGIGSAAAASADTVVKPGTEEGAYCSVAHDDGTVSHFQTPAQCLQAQVAINIAERKAAAEEARQERADARQAERN